jgi:manganese transport protein
MSAPAPARRILHLFTWAVIPAAFIGPGTVTTAASAGAAHGYALLWALVFSTVATATLQEASARVTVVSGRNLAEAIRERYRAGAAGLLVVLLVLGAVVLGNAAYEAGNILGAAAGAELGAGIPPWAAALAIGGVAAAVLWIGTPRAVARLLGVTVAFMGLAFLVTAVLLRPDPGALLRGAVQPGVPAGAGLLVLGLVGTTVVPYNLFLGSGIAHGQTVREIRLGLLVAVALGGAISMAILVVGASVAGDFSYPAVAEALAGRLGGWAGPLFAWGLFAAGFSSAITAPLAAAITARSLFGWRDHGWGYRGVWMGVLAVGIGFGVAGVRPIPAIILAQALNGVLLPFAAVFLMLVVNDRALMGERGLNAAPANALMGAVVAATLALGASGVLRAATAVFGGTATERTILAAAAVLALLLLVPVARGVRDGRRREQADLHR